MDTLQSRTGPVQGQNRVFPVKFSTQGKTCFHYREPLFSLQVPLFSLQEFPCEKTSQGKPCFHYREWVCSVSISWMQIKHLMDILIFSLISFRIWRSACGRALHMPSDQAKEISVSSNHNAARIFMNSQSQLSKQRNSLWWISHWSFTSSTFWKSVSMLFLIMRSSCNFFH